MISRLLYLQWRSFFLGLNYICAVLLYLTLENLFELDAFKEKAKGLATEKIFNSPLTKSKTPTEFWTKRWNHMTHLQLKVRWSYRSLEFLKASLSSAYLSINFDILVSIQY